MTDKSQLTHLVYEASLDNSLWPELILELTDRLQIAQSGQFLPPEGDGALTELTEHFRRAFAISEKMVELQERAADMTSALNTFSVGLALIDDRGPPNVSNQSLD